MATSAGAQSSSRGAANLPDRDVLLGLFEQMVLLRRFESVAQIACRKGETPGFLHLYIGEEATGVGVCAHLRPHRLGDLDASRPRPRAGQGRRPGPRDGRAVRQGRRHLRRPRRHHASLRPLASASSAPTASSAPASATPSASGIGARQRGSDDIGVAFFGDGAANHGGFHEALNFAAVQRAPAVFVCENNLYATATPLQIDHAQSGDRHQGRVLRHAGRGGGRQRRVRGLDWRCRRRPSGRGPATGPTLIEAKTYRTVGHHEGDPVIGTYRTQEEIDAWIKRDPIDMFRKRLDRGLSASPTPTSSRRSRRASRRWSRTRSSSRATRRSRIRRRCGAMSLPIRSTRPRRCARAAVGETRTQGWLEAVRDGIAEEMRANPAHPLFRRGHRRARRQLRPYQGPLAGVRRASGWSTRRSPSRASPPRRSAPRRPARGRSSDLMFADFAFETAGQIFLQAAKLRYMSNGADERADGGARRRRRAAQLRAASQRHLPSDLRAHAGPHRLRALDAGRRQGADEDRAPGRRSGHHAGAQGAVRLEGRGAGGRASTCRSASRASRAPAPTSPSSRPARWCSARSRRRRRWRPKGSRPR